MTESGQDDNQDVVKPTMSVEPVISSEELAQLRKTNIALEGRNYELRETVRQLRLQAAATESERDQFKREAKKIKGELEQRAGNVMSGLMSMGITSQALSTKQLIELFYRTYNPEEAMREKISGEIEAIGVETEGEAPSQQVSATKAGTAQTVQVPINQEAK